MVLRWLGIVADSGPRRDDEAVNLSLLIDKNKIISKICNIVEVMIVLSCYLLTIY